MLFALSNNFSTMNRALARVSNYMDTEKVKLIMRSFIMSHFSYCPLIWMFHDGATNSRINKIHERALRIAYRDTESSFDELLAKDNSVSVHQRNLQLLMISLSKDLTYHTSLEIMMVFWYEGQIQLLRYRNHTICWKQTLAYITKRNQRVSHPRNL